ncbi:MAG: tetratricopeptide repeat-containing diguanylate cyclase [Meiothermus sp.]|uniref:tetratricopeptide repeat-containing diguanylate cyclase n=1 Tax=Meiothermus sp. TaxID=1955249 RepID=UPI00298EFE73|nr:tetratricopeptide repeat-containing diguanylate cyclase [Meiothermus sp.]MDW8424557.1 tetratricopeptide repeat-containing diguanylate cyclase [Meiothermus sp.]
MSHAVPHLSSSAAPSAAERVLTLVDLGGEVLRINPAQALDMATQAEQLCQEHGLARLRLPVLSLLAESQYRLGHYLEARANLNTLLSLGPDQPLAVKSLNLLGHVQRRLGEHRSAIQHYNQALELAHRLDDKNQEFTALNGLAGTYFSLFDYQGAAELYLHCLGLAQGQGNADAEGTALGNLGAVYLEQGDLTRALELFQKGLEISVRLGNQQREAVLRNNLGFTHYRLDAHQSSLEYSQQALELAQKLRDRRTEASALGNLALTYFALGQYDTALELNKRALEIERELHNRHTEADLLVQIGRIWLEKRSYEMAQSTLEEALQVAQSGGNRKAHTEVHLYLSEVWQHKGQFALALQQHRLYHELTVATLREQIERKTLALLIRFQAEQALQQAEIVRLRNVELVAANEALEQLNREKSQLLARLEELVRTDPLTQLYNRGYLEEQLERLFQQSRQEQWPLSVALIDLDHFKGINDTYSHQAGDLVLKTTATLFRETLPEAEIIARYGGEEFAIVFPQTAAAEAAAACERLRQRIEAHDWSFIHPDLVVTVSIGVSDAPAAPNHEKLLMAADQYLYDAKRRRRNQVCFGS